MTRIKICGITTSEDALAAARLGADAVGLVFATSPRIVTPRLARDIVAVLPPDVSAVGVFVNSTVAAILNAVRNAGLNEVQLHGDESPGLIRRLNGIRIVKALRVMNTASLDSARRFMDAGVSALLLDSYSTTKRGGTGRQFNWHLIQSARKAGTLEAAWPIILAGGLTASNVQRGIQIVHPWGVDVSGGVESQPGRKSKARMAKFIEAVHRADARSKQ